MSDTETTTSDNEDEEPEVKKLRYRKPLFIAEMSDNDSRDGTPVNFLRSRLAALERNKDTPDGSIASRESTPGPSPIPSRLSRSDLKEDSSRASTPTSDVSSPRKPSPRKGSRSRSRRGGRSRSRRKTARKVILDEDDNSSTIPDHPDGDGSLASNDVSMDATNCSLPNGDENSVIDNQDNESVKSSLSGIAELSGSKTEGGQEAEKQNQTEINDSMNDCDSNAKPSGSISPEIKSNPRSPVSMLNNDEHNESLTRSPVRSHSSLSNTSAKSDLSAISKTESKSGVNNGNGPESMNVSRPESPMDTTEQKTNNEKTTSPEIASQSDNLDRNVTDSHEVPSSGKVSPISLSDGNSISNPQIVHSAQASESESISEKSLPFDTYGLSGVEKLPTEILLVSKRERESPVSVASHKSGLSHDSLKETENKQNPKSPHPEQSVLDVDGDESAVSSRNQTPKPDDKDNLDDSASTSPYSGSEDETKREEDSSVSKMESGSVETKTKIKDEPLSDAEMDENKRDQNGNRMEEEIKKEIKEEGKDGEKNDDIKQEVTESGEVKTETGEIKKEEEIKKEAEESEDEQPEITVSGKMIILL